MARVQSRFWMVEVTLGFTMLVGAGCVCASASERPPSTGNGGMLESPEIAFRVHDYAHLPESTMTKVESEAGKVLSQAGIHSRWQVLGDNAPEGCLNAGAASPIPVIDVNILTSEMSSHLDLPQRALGYTFTSGVVPPLVAGVLYGRALEMAEHHIASLDELLGYAIAHEVGHLLLPSAPHSRWGIMQATWGLEEIAMMSTGTLYFNKQESARMRAAVAARSAADSVMGSTPCGESKGK